MNIFSRKPNAKEALRDSKRQMVHATRGSLSISLVFSSLAKMTEFDFTTKCHHCRRSNRVDGIEKEITSLQTEEKKLVAEIKRTAKTGNDPATKVLAHQLVRLRQQIANLQGSRAQMRGIATHTQAMSAHTSVAAGMKGATKAMTAMNKQVAPGKQMKVMQEFQKQSAKMDMTTEMMSDAIDDAVDIDEAEEETEELTNQVLDEIGVDVASQLSAAPKGKIAGKKAEDGSSLGIDELEKRLEALRNP